MGDQRAQAPGRAAPENWILACAAGVIYYILARVGMRFAFGSELAPVFWPAAGFALAAVLLWGRGAAAGVFLGALLAHEPPFPPGASAAAAAAGAALTAAGAAAQALFGAALLQSLSDPWKIPRRARDTAIFCALAPLIGIVGPLFQELALAPTGPPPGYGWTRAGLTWWLGDVVGLLVAAPLILAWSVPRKGRLLPTPARAAEGLAASALLAAGAWLSFAYREEPLLWVTFPAVFWILFRFGPRASTAAIAALGATVVGLSAEGSLIIISSTVQHSLRLSSAYLAALAATALLSRALLDERESAIQSLSAEARAARRRAEMDLRTFEHLPTGLAILRLAEPGDPESLRVVDVNPAGLRLAGAPADAERREGAALREFWPALHEAGLTKACTDVLRARKERAESASSETMNVAGEFFDIVVFALSEQEAGVAFENVTELKRAQHVVQDAAGLLLLMLESVQEYAIFRLDLQGRVASWSKGAAIIYGYEAEDILGRPYLRLLSPQDEAESPVGNPLDRTARDGRAAAEGPCRRKDGSAFWADCAFTALRGEDGIQIGTVAVVRDASVRRQQEQDLAGKSAALARSNVELTQFAYVASHDLNAPLHKVKAFGDRLKQKIEGALDDESRDYLQRMMRSIDAMQQLIDGLLALARVTTRGGAAEPVDLAALAKDVVEALGPAVSASKARLTIGPLPRIHADPLQMRQLLQNLIGNAVKFHRPGARPVVRVSGKATDGGLCEIVVADNGIGLDMKYAERIFQPFQRLNSAFDYEGSGIGLAICRKIAERHGGSIRVLSKPDHGAEFTVVLPISQEGRLECQFPEKASR